MASRVRLTWSPRAKQDLKDIYAYIAADDPKAAKRFVAKLRDWAGRLVEQPEIGRIVPGFDSPELRERILDSYHIVYQRQSRKVQIITIWHSAQNKRSIPKDLGSST